MLIDRMLNLVASRAGVTAIMATLAVFSIGTLFLLFNGWSSASQVDDLFRNPHYRAPTVVLSDINRAEGAAMRLYAAELEEAAEIGQRQDDFLTAIDILFVRGDALKVHEYPFARAEASALRQSLLALVDVADRHIETDFADPAALLRELSAAAETTRARVVHLTEELNHLLIDSQDGTMLAIFRLTYVHGAFLALLLLFALLAMALVQMERRERTKKREAQARVHFLAFNDPLTKIANRTGFTEAAQNFLAPGPQGITQNHGWSICLIDLDGFKLINDAFGTEAGDAVLCSVARSVAAIAVDHNAICARLAADEFAILVPGLKEKKSGAFAALVSKAMPRRIVHHQEPILIHPSVGLAAAETVAKVDDVCFDSVSRAAHHALRCAKADPARDSFKIFDTTMAADMEQQKSLLTDLELAIAKGDLEVWLQPKILLETEKPIGFEALVRWRRNDQIVPPDLFIGLAEENGLIYDIDRFVLRRATQKIAAWNRANPAQPYSVSVNLSTLHLTQDQVVSDIDAALSTSGIAPKHLTLEITETTGLSDWTTAITQLEKIRSRGCKVSLDDFGTGYSSLSYVRQIPADELKLDKSFLNEIETKQEAMWIVDAVIGIAQSLKMSTVVEGLETESQVALVKDLGCTIGQGYFFGRPQPLAQALVDTSGFTLEEVEEILARPMPTPILKSVN